ncbi:hypothetical protein K466DRAFT_668651 [Polyporus arcularius HHB13444]|uniref:Pleurotolysin B C-terminal domain-containing protein n=1 Tax=Polyporus arcularius HHB13444 TaxID=1314778 RepID=A0A5C3NN38_9APHY|nr:hypothetical protein K466DRAFT_668651 [Polyporus arcularius HHB13444]
MFRWVDVERVPATNQYPVDIYRPKGAVPAGWFWLGHTADPSRGLIVKPSLPPKPTRNYAISTGHAATGFSDQPFPDQPQYAFFSSFFGAPFSSGVAPGSDFAALRPGLFLEGHYDLHTASSISSSVYITRPVSSLYPEDDCFDLKPVVRVSQTGTDSPPRPRWALRKNVVSFDSE